MRIPIHNSCFSTVTENFGWLEFHPEFREGYDKKKNIVSENTSFKDFNSYCKRECNYYTQTIRIRRK